MADIVQVRQATRRILDYGELVRTETYVQLRLLLGGSRPAWSWHTCGVVHSNDDVSRHLEALRGIWAPAEVVRAEDASLPDFEINPRGDI